MVRTLLRREMAGAVVVKCVLPRVAGDVHHEHRQLAAGTVVEADPLPSGGVERGAVRGDRGELLESGSTAYNRSPALAAATTSAVPAPRLTPWRTSTLPQNFVGATIRCTRMPSRLKVSRAPCLSLPMIRDFAGSWAFTQMAGSSAESPGCCIGCVSASAGTSTTETLPAGPLDCAGFGVFVDPQPGQRERRHQKGHGGRAAESHRWSRSLRLHCWCHEFCVSQCGIRPSLGEHEGAVGPVTGKGCQAPDPTTLAEMLSVEPGGQTEQVVRKHQRQHGYPETDQVEQDEQPDLSASAAVALTAPREQAVAQVGHHHGDANGKNPGHRGVPGAEGRLSSAAG